MAEYKQNEVCFEIKYGKTHLQHISKGRENLEEFEADAIRMMS